MSETIAYLALPLIITILLMFTLRPAARRLGLIDRPGGRKMHVGEVPVIGGLAMAGGLMASSIYSHEALAQFSYFAVALGVLVVVGALDDRYDLPALARFLAQVCAALLMVGGAGVTAHDIGYVFFGGLVELGWFSIPFSLAIVLTAINAFNMIDGSDGLAGIQALVALAFLGFAAVVAGATTYLPILIALTGCVSGFLIFNWPVRRRRKVHAFMGDAGSTMLGFSLAWISLELSQTPVRAISPVVILWIFATPIYELFSSMVRRLAQRRSPFHGDSQHLHHVLRRAGYSARAVALIVMASGATTAAIGVGGYVAGVEDGWLFLAWLALGVVYHVIFVSGLVFPKGAVRTARDDLLAAKLSTGSRQR